MKNLSWQQVILCLGLVAALILSGIYLPTGMAQVAQTVALVFAFFRDPRVNELKPGPTPSQVDPKEKE